MAHFNDPSAHDRRVSHSAPAHARLRAARPSATRKTTGPRVPRHIPSPRSPDNRHLRNSRGGWTGKELILAVRVTAGNGKQTGWSNLVVVPVIATPARPNAVTRLRAQGVHLTWRAPGDNFGYCARPKAGTMPRWRTCKPPMDRRHHRVREALHIRGPNRW